MDLKPKVDLKQIKPPLGVPPVYVWLEERITVLTAACARYYNFLADHPGLPISRRRDLLDSIKKWNEEINSHLVALELQKDEDKVERAPW